MHTDPLRDYIIAATGQPPPGLDRVLAAFEPVKTTGRKTILVEAGTVCRYCYFIVSGCIQTISYDRNGNAATVDLGFEQDWRTSVSSFINRNITNERLVAVQSSELLAIRRDRFQELLETVPPFEQLYQQLLQRSYTQSMQRIQTLMSLDARDRFRFILQERPLIFSRLSNRLIASYLSMSEATLSRFKREIYPDE